MIIYNTTYCVSQRAYNNFIKWLKERHLPQMLSSGFFGGATAARVLTEGETDENSVSVQLTADDLAAVEAWNDAYGDLFRMEIASLFGEEVLYFSTFMETI